MNDPQEQRTEAVLRIAEEDLCARIIEFSPEIRSDVQVMAQIIRELVDLERAKVAAKNLGDIPGKIRITLYPDKVPRAGIDPCHVGTLRLGGRSFLVRAWLVNNTSAINLEFKMM